MCSILNHLERKFSLLRRVAIGSRYEPSRIVYNMLERVRCVFSNFDDLIKQQYFRVLFKFRFCLK